jgi:hypothetical protein
MVASNNDWAVPAGVGDRRWFVLQVANTYAGMENKDYWSALHAEIDKGGPAAMLHDLLAIDLTNFDLRAIPHTAAKAQQQALSLRGTAAWLYHVLQEGELGDKRWNVIGLSVRKDHAYECYKDFAKQRREWSPEIKSIWSKNVRLMLGCNVRDARPTSGRDRVRSFEFGPLSDCRMAFASHIGSSTLEWQDPDIEPNSPSGAVPLHTPDDLGNATI